MIDPFLPSASEQLVGVNVLNSPPAYVLALLLTPSPVPANPGSLVLIAGCQCAHGSTENINGHRSANPDALGTNRVSLQLSL